MRGLWLFNTLSSFCLFSPPILLGIAWVRFLNFKERSGRPKWRHVLGATNLIAVSVLLGLCVVRFLGNNCNPDASDWSCVLAWRSFAGLIVRSAPFFLALTIFGAKRTRILSLLSVLAIVFDVILVGMMA